jgi:hypothetical protein
MTALFLASDILERSLGRSKLQFAFITMHASIKWSWRILFLLACISSFAQPYTPPVPNHPMVNYFLQTDLQAMDNLGTKHNITNVQEGSFVSLNLGGSNITSWSQIGGGGSGTVTMLNADSLSVVSWATATTTPIPTFAKMSASQFGVGEVDNLTITAATGVIGAGQMGAAISNALMSATNTLNGMLTVTSNSYTALSTVVSNGLVTWDNATFQLLNTKLTSISALANGSGVLSNNGSGTFSYVIVPQGTVTSVAMAADTAGVVSWAGSPITGSGTFTPTFSKASSSQFGVMEVDNASLKASAGVVSASGIFANGITNTGTQGITNNGPFTNNGSIYDLSEYVSNSLTLPYISSAGVLAVSSAGAVTETSSPAVSGASLTANTIPLASFAQGTSGQVIIANTGSADTYSSTPAISGANFTANTVPLASLAEGTSGQVLVANTSAASTWSGTPSIAGLILSGGFTNTGGSMSNNGTFYNDGAIDTLTLNATNGATIGSATASGNYFTVVGNGYNAISVNANGSSTFVGNTTVMASGANVQEGFFLTTKPPTVTLCTTNALSVVTSGITGNSVYVYPGSTDGSTQVLFTNGPSFAWTNLPGKILCTNTFAYARQGTNYVVTLSPFHLTGEAAQSTYIFNNLAFSVSNQTTTSFLIVGNGLGAGGNTWTNAPATGVIAGQWSVYGN